MDVARSQGGDRKRGKEGKKKKRKGKKRREGPLTVSSLFSRIKGRGRKGKKRGEKGKGGKRGENKKASSGCASKWSFCESV